MDEEKKEISTNNKQKKILNPFNEKFCMFLMGEALCIAVKWYAFDWFIIKHFEVSFPHVRGHSSLLKRNDSALILSNLECVQTFILLVKYLQNGYFLWLKVLEPKMISKKCETVFR